MHVLPAGRSFVARRLSALERVIIPAYRGRDLHAVLGDLEEDERDEMVRRRAWVSGRTPGG